VLHVEKHAPRTDILSLGLKFFKAFDSHHGGQAHVEAPHGPPFLWIRLHSHQKCPRSAKLNLYQQTPRMDSEETELTIN
jgi:hypothetical protein